MAISATAPQFHLSGSVVMTFGEMTAGSNALNVVATTSFIEGQGAYVVGAGPGGTTLQAVITAIVGTVLYLTINASTSVVVAQVGHDDSFALQSALSAVGALGGVVDLPAGSYNAHVTLPTRTWLRGEGQRATYIKAIPGVVADGIVMIAGVAKACGLSNLGLLGNKTAVPAPVCSGLSITSTLTGGLRAHVIENVDITAPTLDGIRLWTIPPARIVALLMRNVYVSEAGHHGFHLSNAYVSDCTFAQCSTGLTGWQGWRVLGGTHMFDNCSADDAGQISVTNGLGAGWAFVGPGAVGSIQAGCRSADNLGPSVLFEGANRTNRIDLLSYHPRGPHVQLTDGYANRIVVLVSDIYGVTPLAPSVLQADGGLGNLLDLQWTAASLPVGAIPLVGASMMAQQYTRVSPVL